MKQFLCIALLIAGFSSASVGQVLSDAEIQKAMDRGKNSSTKQLWKEIKKTQHVRINRAGLDPIEKTVTFLSDVDRISLESAEAKRQLREITIDEVKRNLPLGTTEVLLEANCYNNLYAGSLPKWGPQGGVHLVLKVNGMLIQPIERRTGPSDSVSVLPQEHGVISGQGNSVTYTPLYRTAIYERASLRSWFSFPVFSPDTKTLTVIAISGDGNRKEKEIENPFR